MFVGRTSNWRSRRPLSFVLIRPRLRLALPVSKSSLVQLSLRRSELEVHAFDVVVLERIRGFAFMRYINPRLID